MDFNMIEKYPALRNAVIFETPDGGIISNTTSSKLFKLDQLNGWNLNIDGVRLLKSCTGDKNLLSIIRSLCDTDEDLQKSTPMVLQFFQQMSSELDLEFSNYPTHSCFHISGSTEYFSPIHVSIELTNNCNMKCIYCYNNSGPSQKEFMKDPIKLLQDLLDNGIRTLELTGGEPLTHPEFTNILKFACSNFDFIAILTNGLLINDEHLEVFDKYSEKILIQCSLDSLSPETYNAVTGSNKLHIAKRNISSLSKCNVKFTITTTISAKEQIDDIEDICIYAKSSGAFRYIMTPAVKMGRRRDDNLNPAFQPEDIMKLNDINELLMRIYKDFYSIDQELLVDRSKEGSSCGAGSKNATITSNKSIVPCNMIDPRILNIGSCKDGYLTNELNHDLIQYFSAVVTPTLQDCDPCEYKYDCWGCFARAIENAREIGLDKCTWIMKPEQAILLDALRL